MLEPWGTTPDPARFLQSPFCLSISSCCRTQQAGCGGGHLCRRAWHPRRSSWHFSRGALHARRHCAEFLAVQCEAEPGKAQEMLTENAGVSTPGHTHLTSTERPWTLSQALWSRRLLIHGAEEKTMAELRVDSNQKETVWSTVCFVHRDGKWECHAPSRLKTTCKYCLTEETERKCWKISALSKPLQAL